LTAVKQFCQSAIPMGEAETCFGTPGTCSCRSTTTSCLTETCFGMAKTSCRMINSHQVSFVFTRHEITRNDRRLIRPIDVTSNNLEPSTLPFFWLTELHLQIYRLLLFQEALCSKCPVVSLARTEAAVLPAKCVLYHGGLIRVASCQSSNKTSVLLREGVLSAAGLLRY
jgi:hypothetical protein